LLPDVVDRVALPRLIALNSASWQTGMIVGPVLAGFLYAGQPWWPYIATCALLVVAIVSISLVRIHHAEPVKRSGERPALHEALEGLRVIRDNPILLGAISLDLFAVLFGGAVALLPAIAEDQLGVGAVGLGWLRASIGIGASITTLILAARPLTRRVGRTLLTVVAMFGVFTIVLGLTHSFAVAFMSLLLLSAADAVSVFIRATLVPLITPPASRGRVMAVENVFIGASNELGAFESGLAAQLLGISPAVVLGGLATIGVAGAWWFLFPGLRNVDRFSEVYRAEPSPGTGASAPVPASEAGA
jgi:MFS family permease